MDSKQTNDIFNGIAVNIALNVIAGVIFWIAFDFVPESLRRNKLRPKLELGIYQVYINLFFLFDSIMRFSAHSPSFFQMKIKGKCLSSGEIELGLQNKCLND